MSEATVDATVDSSRRTWLITSCAMGGVGAAAVAVPFVSSFQPSERAKAAGAAIEVDISTLQPGEKRVVEWRGKPVWIMRRTPEQLAALEKQEDQLADPNSDRKTYPTPEYAKNRHRSIKPEVLVAVGICTHLGCSPGDKFTPGPQPSLPDDWQGGFLRSGDPPSLHQTRSAGCRGHLHPPGLFPWRQVPPRPSAFAAG